jgi:hypothetical protein
MRNSHKLNVWLTLFVATLVGMFGVNVASGVQNATPTPSPVQRNYPLIQSTVQPICPPDCSHIRGGMVIVKLKGEFTPEKELSKEALELQHRAIQNNQSNFLSFLKVISPARETTQPDSYVIAIHKKSPYSVIYLNYNHVSSVSKNPLVERIYNPDPFGDFMLLGLDQVSIEEDASNLTSETIEPQKSKCIEITCEQMLKRLEQEKQLPIIALLNLNITDYRKFNNNQASIIFYRKSKIYRLLSGDLYNSSQQYTAYDLFIDRSSTILHLTVSSSGLKKLIESPEIVKFGVDKAVTGELDFLNDYLTPTGSVTHNPNQTKQASQALPPPDQNIKHIGADTAWSNGITGKEHYIVLIDDGVWRDQPALASNTEAGECHLPAGSTGWCTPRNDWEPNASKSAHPCHPIVFPAPTPVGGGPTPTVNPAVISRCGHGTWISGAAVGNYNSGGVSYRGASYESRLIPFRGIDTSNTSSTQIISGLEWGLQYAIDRLSGQIELP